MKTTLTKLTKIKRNPNNPRVIVDEKLERLVNSIRNFPEMLEIRPIVVNDDMVVLGGNMRLRACKEAGLKEVPVIKASNLTDEQQQEFIIKDNVGTGDWDWNILSTEWDSDLLDSFGLITWNGSDVDLDDFFEDDTGEKNNVNKIVLEYTDEEYPRIIELFGLHQGTKESVVWDLLQP